MFYVIVIFRNRYTYTHIFIYIHIDIDTDMGVHIYMHNFCINLPNDCFKSYCVRRTTLLENNLSEKQDAKACQFGDFQHRLSWNKRPIVGINSIELLTQYKRG